MFSQAGVFHPRATKTTCSLWPPDASTTYCNFRCRCKLWVRRHRNADRQNWWNAILRRLINSKIQKQQQEVG